MQRRYFDHIYSEICVALNRRISRYDLWLRVAEGVGDPDELTPDQARAFVDGTLGQVIRREGVRLDDRARRRLERSILRFDPRYPTPEEWMARAFDQNARRA